MDAKTLLVISLMQQGDRANAEKDKDIRSHMSKDQQKAVRESGHKNVTYGAGTVRGRRLYR